MKACGLFVVRDNLVLSCLHSISDMTTPNAHMSLAVVARMMRVGPPAGSLNKFSSRGRHSGAIHRSGTAVPSAIPK